MIRPACFLDIPEIINLGCRYVEEEVKVVGHHTADWDAEHSACGLIDAYARPDQFLHVAVIDGEIVGFLWAVSHELAPWNPAMVASDYLFYIVPERRGTMLAPRLIKEYKAWAESIGCVEARLSIASGITEEQTGRLYQRLGFSPFGTVYNYNIGEHNVGS